MVVLIAIGLGVVLFLSLIPLGQTLSSRIENVIQVAGIFVALLASVIALASADPQKKPAKARISVSVNKSDNLINRHPKARLSGDLLEAYQGFPDPVESHRVQFEITNVSGFTLKKPTVTFRLPLDKQHPSAKPSEVSTERTFRSNLYNSQSDLRLLEFADTLVLSNSNLPYWNDQDQTTIWIKMVLNDGELEPFSVEVSINAENAEGVTRDVTISPERLLV